MTAVDFLVQTASSLPPDKLQEVLDFAQFLSQKHTRIKLRDAHGVWKGVNVSEEDIDQIRKEAWGKYAGDAR